MKKMKCPECGGELKNKVTELDIFTGDPEDKLYLVDILACSECDYKILKESEAV